MFDTLSPEQISRVDKREKFEERRQEKKKREKQKLAKVIKYE